MASQEYPIFIQIAFPIIHQPEFYYGLETKTMIEHIPNTGISVSKSPYSLLHRLQLFGKDFDIFTENRGPLCGDYAGYKKGDFPISAEMYKHLIFLPVLSEPVKGALKKVIAMLKQAVDSALS